MLISCKCLNFIATNSNKMAAEDSNNNLPAALMQSFLQRYSRNFVFYSPCMDFFKQSFGPIVDLTINALNQRDLIYSLTLDLPNSQASWQLSICVNCNTALCAKRVQANHAQQPYLINSALLTSNDEVAHRRTDKSFSEAFGLLIMDHPELKNHPTTPTAGASAGSITNFNIGSAMSVNSFSSAINVDCKQQRLRQLQHNLQQRLKREIAETDERIQRYTEQQFALLKSFREKSEQEYQLLVGLIQQVPEQYSSGADCLLDRSPPALEVNGTAPLSYASRRRTTINSRRDLNTSNATSGTAPTTPTTPNISSAVTSAPIFATTATTSSASSSSFLVASSSSTSTSSAAAAAAPESIPKSVTSPVTASTDGDTQGINRITNSSVGMLTSANAAQRKLSNFDTPPATPEATPMSVGNSPTFKQQQQQQQPQQQQQQHPPPPPPPQSFGGNNVRLLATQMSFQQQFPTPTAEMNDDCIFELEGIEDNSGGSTMATIPLPAAAILTLQRMQQRETNTHYMSDIDKSDDDAEEAEDALDMEHSVPITMKHVTGYRFNNNNNNNTSGPMPNYAKSLPIAISNSPLFERNVGRPINPILNVDAEEDELDNTVDIAASIKALAKSVHGEAVFGDLPRPRLRSQI